MLQIVAGIYGLESKIKYKNIIFAKIFDLKQILATYSIDKAFLNLYHKNELADN